MTAALAHDTRNAFAALLGTGRGSNVTPWDKLSPADRDQAAASVRRQWVVHVVHHNGGQYAGTDELRASIRAIADALRTSGKFGLALIEAVETAIASDPALLAGVRAATHSRARDGYTEWLDCGHAPAVTSYGPASTLYGNRSTCRDCAVNIELARMRAGEEPLGALSRDAKTVGTVTGGELARVTRSWTANNGRTYWNAVDADGVKWRGHCSQPGSHTQMRRAD